MKTIEINGAEYELLLGRKSAWSAIEAAGIKVWRNAEGHVRAYDTADTGGYVYLEMCHADGLAYPCAKTHGGKVTGAFAARVRAAVDAAVGAKRAARVSV